MIVLFDHQRKVLDQSKDRVAYAWFLETGTGKTILACENLKYLYNQGKIKAAIIAAPKTILKSVWFNTLINLYIDDMNFYIFQWSGGFDPEAEQRFNTVINKPESINRLIILIVNIEAFSHNRVLNYAKQLCLKYPTAWFIDESTTIKNHSAKRTKQVIALSHLAQYRRIMSGFPVLRSPEDLYTQMQFLSPELTPHKSFYSFRNQYCITKRLDNRITVSIGARNTSELQHVLSTFSSRILKKDCLDLPDKLGNINNPNGPNIRLIEMTDEQRQLYQKMAREGHILLKNTRKEIFASTLLTQLEKLHQIASGIIANPLTYIKCNKIDELLNIIKNEIVDKQFIVWCCYVGLIKSINITLQANGINSEQIYGEITIKRRNEIIEKFVDGKLDCIVANPSTAMHGLTLIQATYAIYFNNSFNLEHRIQSEDRLHRIGQVNKVTYIDLITEKTIENKVLQNLEEKHNIGAQSLGDEWEDWFQ